MFTHALPLSILGLTLQKSNFCASQNSQSSMIKVKTPILTNFIPVWNHTSANLRKNLSLVQVVAHTKHCVINHMNCVLITRERKKKHLFFPKKATKIAFILHEKINKKVNKQEKSHTQKIVYN